MRTDLISARLQTAKPSIDRHAQVQEKIKEYKSYEEDAAVVQLRKDAKAQDSASVYKRIPARPIAPADIKDIEAPEKPVFSPGATLSGVYGVGEFKTENGHSGNYYALNGGRIGFEINGFQGILSGNEATAYNPETGESYTMNIRYGGGKFEITNIEEAKPQQFEPKNQKPVVVEGDTKHFKMRYDDTGKIQVEIHGIETDEVQTGEGVLLPDGTFTIRFGEQSAVTGSWRFNADGQLELYRRGDYIFPNSKDRDEANSQR